MQILSGMILPVAPEDRVYGHVDDALIVPAGLAQDALPLHASLLHDAARLRVAH